MLQPFLLHLIIFNNQIYKIYFKINISLISIIVQYNIFSFIKFFVGSATLLLTMYVKFYQITHLMPLNFRDSWILVFWGETPIRASAPSQT